MFKMGLYRYVVTPQKIEQVIITISSRIYSTKNLRFCLFGVCSYISYINILLCSVRFFLYPAIVVSYFPYIVWLVVWNMFFSHSVGNVMIPTDELHHCSEG